MNKDRLYLAFYKRGQVKPDDAKYHTALLLVPKKVKDGNVVQRYHVKKTKLSGAKSNGYFLIPRRLNLAR